MSHKRLKGKSIELLLASSNHFSLVLSVIIAFTLGVMPMMALYLLGDVISDDTFTVLLLLFVIFLFIPLITGIYRMAGLAYWHKEYGIVDVFFAFSSFKNYFRVFLVNAFGIIKNLIPLLAGFIWFGLLAAFLKDVKGAEWIALLSAIAVGMTTLPLVKRFYAVSFLVCVEEMGFVGAIKRSLSYTKGKSIKLALATVRFLPVTVLSFIAIMVPFVVYNFPFRICLYSVICGELKSEYEREHKICEIKNDICPEVISEGVEEINE